MDWLDEVRIRLKKRNQVLFTKDMEYLQDLTMLFREQNHKIMVLWALDLAAESVAELEEKYPDENRPREALEAAWAWAAGTIKMRPAQRKILDCHAFAKEIDIKENIALCHAIGQACAVVHARVYPLFVNKAVRKGRTAEEVDQVIQWLTGYDADGLKAALDAEMSYEVFFAEAPMLNPNRKKITGMICGVKVDSIEEPLMREIRYLDKLVDELAKGKSLEKIFRE